jgi:hypothetical protein
LVGIWALPWLREARWDSAFEISDNFGGRVAIECRVRPSRRVRVINGWVNVTKIDFAHETIDI